MLIYCKLQNNTFLNGDTTKNVENGGIKIELLYNYNIEDGAV